MEQVIHRSDTRGHYNYGWLDTRHTFSFARYFDPHRTGFGALRVLNDDVVKPNMGFGKHPHDNMEIISIPLKGALKHKDSEGHEQIIKENEVQVMSAGTGLFHSEYNASTTDEVNFLQIWIYPEKRNVTPRYDQKYFEPSDAENKWQTLVSSSNEHSLMIHQNATVSRTFLQKGNNLTANQDESSFGTYFFIIEGSVEVQGVTLNKRDGMGTTKAGPIQVSAISDACILKITVPDRHINND